MKKSFLLLSLIFISYIGYSQVDDSTKYTHYRFQYGSRMDRYVADKMFYIPYVQDTLEKGFRPGALIKLISNGLVYQWEDGKWTMFGGGLDATKVPLTRTITINGNTQDLSTNRTWTLTKSDIGLGNVDNTSDINKPMSTAQQAALDDTAQDIRSTIAAATTTASGGITKVGNDFRLGGTLPGSASIDGLNTGYFSMGNMSGIDLYGPTTGGGAWGISSNFGDMSLIWERDKARRAINMNVQNGGMILNTSGVPGFGNGSSFILDTLGRFYLNGLKPAASDVADSILMWSPALGQVKYRSLASLPFATQAALDDSALALRAAMIIPPKIVIGTEVDPLYSLSVKKVYDNVTQANFSTTVGKYPFYVDKDVRFTEDSMSMGPVPGDNAGLNILRYKGQSILNLENTVNRFTAHHTVLALEKYPGFMDTTIFKGRASPFPAETCVPSAFSAILSQSQGGLASTRPNISKGWFAALSAEVQMGGTAFNKAENMIWIHTGGIGNAFTGAITNGYGLYINPFGAGVTNKYAIYQQGTLDTVQFNGKIKIPNLVLQNDTTQYKLAVVDANGNLFKSNWASGGGSGTVTDFVFTDGNGFDGTVSTSTTTPTLSLTTSLTTGSNVFIGSGGALAQDNTNNYWDNTNKRQSIAAGTSPLARLHINTDALGGTTTSTSLNSSGIFLSSTTPATNGAQQMSPGIVMRGNGYGTTGSASQTTDWKMQVLPVQGTTPSSQLVFSSSINGTTYVSPINFTSGGMINANSLVTSGAIVSGAASFLGWQGRSTMYSPSNGSITLTNQAGTDFTSLILGPATSSHAGLFKSGTTLLARLGDNSADAPFGASSLTLSGLSGTGTRLGTVSSTGVSGAITNGTDGQVMTMVSGSPAWASAPTGGTYNPTFSNLGTGVSSVTATGSKVWYTRVGNIVTITGRIEPIFSSGTTGDHREFTMSLPPGITANLTDPNDAQGVANCTWSTTRTAMVNWDASNDVIKFDVQIGSEDFSDARAVHFTVTFQIP